MLFRPKYGRIGWFALPTFWLFEYYGVIIEVVGYLMVATFFAVEHLFNIPVLNEQTPSPSRGPRWVVTPVNVFAVLVVRRFRYGLADRLQRGCPLQQKGDADPAWVRGDGELFCGR
jgi:hypothetical protein